MTKEELMKPRYEVVADYPGRPMTMPIGHILVLDKFGAGKYWHEYTDEEPIHIDEGSTRFPKVLRLLYWWEQRKPEEMPEYVKYTIRGFIIKCSDCWNGEMYVVDEYSFSWRYCEPATETEYTNYITQTK